MTQHKPRTKGVGSALRYPETKVAGCSMSCRLPQIDLIAQGADASRELMCDRFAVALASAEIGGPQVGMLEPGASLLDAPRALLAGALVEPRHDPGPAQEMAGSREDAHVRTDL